MWKEVTLKSDDKVEDGMLVTRWLQDEQAVAVRWFCLLVSFGLCASSQLPNITTANVYLTKTWYFLNLVLRVVSGRFFPIRVVNKSNHGVCTLSNQVKTSKACSSWTSADPTGEQLMHSQ